MTPAYSVPSPQPFKPINPCCKNRINEPVLAVARLDQWHCSCVGGDDDDDDDNDEWFLL